LGGQIEPCQVGNLGHCFDRDAVLGCHNP
jgi:hypothetical protein